MSHVSHGDGGETSAWIGQVLALYEGRLLAYARRITGCPDRARDVVQETFLKLCRRPPAELKALDGHLGEWLYTVCRNQALDVLRKELRMNTSAEARIAFAPGGVPPAAELAEQRDAAECLLGLIRELPAAQQEVLRLKFHGGLSYREIAGVTGLSITNVGFQLHQALTTLRRRMRVAE